MADNQVTITGNITDDPELRFTPSGQAVANFTVAVNRRFRNNQTNEWEDRLDGFFRCSCWRDQAENVAESLTKGTRVVVVGRLQQRSWDDAESGQKRSTIEIQVDEVAPSLRWATATIQKSQRSGGGGSAAASSDWGTPSPVASQPQGSEGGF
jgi:single-strand DNA-binding protein